MLLFLLVDICIGILSQVALYRTGSNLPYLWYILDYFDDISGVVRLHGVHVQVRLHPRPVQGRGDDEGRQAGH